MVMQMSDDDDDLTLFSPELVGTASAPLSPLPLFAPLPIK